MSKLCLKFDAHAVCLFLSRSFGPVIGAFYSPRDSCVVIVRRVARRRSAIRNGTATTDRWIALILALYGVMVLSLSPSLSWPRKVLWSLVASLLGSFVAL